MTPRSVPTTVTPAALLCALLGALLLGLCGVMSPTDARAAKSATPTKLYPSITKVAPSKAGIGDRMTITGKGFRKGKNKNTVVFKRDGKRAIFVRATGTSTKRISVLLPAKLLPMLAQKKGTAVSTRFRVRVLAARFGKRYTSTKSSPMIGPVPLSTKGVSNDCDGDGIKNATDKDDDNDLLSDTLEASLGTAICLRDSDADGMSDAWEYYSALDRNGKAKPAPTRKPYPNALDKADAAVDHDGDGLTNVEEYVAWVMGSSKLRAQDSDPFTSRLSYSGGNPNSDGRALTRDTWLDRDGNGFLSDLERDADGDGIQNLDEERGNAADKGSGFSIEPFGPYNRPLGLFTAGFLAEATKIPVDLGLKCAGVNDVPVFCKERLTLDVSKVDTLSWLDADTDGDGLKDAADDVDNDDVSNATEFAAVRAAYDTGATSIAHLDACKPNRNSRYCLLGGGGQADSDLDGTLNADDPDDDNDLIADTRELEIGTDPNIADTDGDGISDGYEFLSAIDLNSSALPYPAKRPYPNPLDKSDANVDHDGDGLSLAQEFAAWVYPAKVGKLPPNYRGKLPLSYSDGQQWTGGKTPAAVDDPADIDDNRTISDDEKDVDGDGATNYAEANGPLSGPSWWDRYTSELRNRSAGCDNEVYTETAYKEPKYAGLDFTDPDTDGDGVADGIDDIDHDGLTNSEEAFRLDDWCETYVSIGGRGNDPGHNWNGAMAVPEFGVTPDPYARMQPFNPCKPLYSDACHLRVPLGHYKEIPATDTDPGYYEDWKSPCTATPVQIAARPRQATCAP